MRTHDAPLDNPGMRLGDTSLIFANWHDDPSDPQNYYFEQTDDYLLNTIAQGTDIVITVSESALTLNQKVCGGCSGRLREVCGNLRGRDPPLQQRLGGRVSPEHQILGSLE